MMRRFIAISVSFLGFLFASVSAQATLVGYNACAGANECLVAPDEAAIPNPIVADPNDGILLGWDEKQNVTLTEKLYVDRVADPLAGFLGSDSGGTFIKAGTIVSSHYFQWDPGNGSSSSVQAQLDFDSEIFAFITSDSNLFASDDPLGLDGFDYADFGLRGLEGGDSTDFAPGGDNSLVNIDWGASSPGDWTRLVTAFSPSADEPPSATVPEPSSAILLALGLVSLISRRFIKA